MRRILSLGAGLVLATGVLSGCGDEDPTEVGGPIVGEGFRTYEVILEASEFLEADTTYDSLGSINAAPFLMVANAFEGELFAHTLVKINRPEQVTWDDADGVTRTDSVFTVVGGTLTVVVDTLGDATGPIPLEVSALTESWDPATATWDLRVDTAGVATPWTVPGGTPGAVLGTGTWTAGDTVRIALDSAAAAVWDDSTGAEHGGLIRSAATGTRLRIQALEYQFDVRPESADTIVPAGSAGRREFVVTPEPSEPGMGVLRVGGIPTWRSALKFRPLADFPIPCAAGSTTCTLPLSEASVNVATLRLHPLPVGARRIERPMAVEVRTVLRARGVPISRSALTGALGSMDEPLEPEDFTTSPPEPAIAEVPVTPYVRDQLEIGEGDDPLLWVAVLAQGEQASPAFGYAAFGSIVSDRPPQLRLVVTVPNEEVGQ